MHSRMARINQDNDIQLRFDPDVDTALRTDPTGTVSIMVFGRPSPGLIDNLFSGAGSVLVFMPPHRQRDFGDDFLRRSDEDILRSDWEQVGIDLRNAMDQHTEGLVRHGEQI